jgi:hypothetical protein
VKAQPIKLAPAPAVAGVVAGGTLPDLQAPPRRAHAKHHPAATKPAPSTPRVTKPPTPSTPSPSAPSNPPATPVRPATPHVTVPTRPAAPSKPSKPAGPISGGGEDG